MQLALVPVLLGVQPLVLLPGRPGPLGLPRFDYGGPGDGGGVVVVAVAVAVAVAVGGDGLVVT
jgi:hypothetical protein